MFIDYHFVLVISSISDCQDPASPNFLVTRDALPEAKVWI